MLKVNHEKNARVTDQSVAALITDLKQRGLLDETIVLWAGEMGRTPHTPAVTADCGPRPPRQRLHGLHGRRRLQGRHRVRRDRRVRQRRGRQPAHGPRHPRHDPAPAGPRPHPLTFRHGGRDQRLTDVHGQVVKEILA